MDNQERPERRTKRVKGARVERGGIVDKLGSVIDTERIKEDIHDRAMSTVTSLVTDTIDGVADVLIGGLEDLLLPDKFSKKRRGRKSDRTSYESAYDRRKRRSRDEDYDEDLAMVSWRDYDDVVVATKKAAIDVQIELVNALRVYKQFTVYDLMDTAEDKRADIQGSWKKLSKYGWTDDQIDERDIDFRHVYNGWKIELPPPKRLED